MFSLVSRPPRPQCTLLEEVTHVDDDEDEGNYTEAWNSPHHSDSDSDDDDNDSNDLDFDFDFD